MFKLTKSFLERVLHRGVEDIEAPTAVETDLLCNKIKFEFNNHSTRITLWHDDIEIAEKETASFAYGSDLVITDIKLYYPIVIS